MSPGDSGLRRRARPANVLAALVAVAFLGLLVYGVSAQGPNTGIDDALVRNRPAPAPPFTLTLLADGHPGPLAPVWRRAAADRRVSLSELRGTPLVVNYWASWCEPCRVEAPTLQRGWEAARQRGVLFVGLDVQDNTEDAERFLREFRQDYPHLRDPDKATGRAWGITGIPETYFLSRQGKVVGHVIGTISAQTLQAGVAAALAGRPIGARRGGAQRSTR